MKYNILKYEKNGFTVYSRVLGKYDRDNTLRSIFSIESSRLGADALKKQIDESLLDEQHTITKIESIHGNEIIMLNTIKRT